MKGSKGATGLTAVVQIGLGLRSVVGFPGVVVFPAALEDLAVAGAVLGVFPAFYRAAVLVCGEVVVWTE